MLEGLTLSEAAVQQPEAFQLLRNQADDVALPGGESPNEMRQRVVGELQRIASQHPGGFPTATGRLGYWQGFIAAWVVDGRWCIEEVRTEDWNIDRGRGRGTGSIRKPRPGF